MDQARELALAQAAVEMGFMKPEQLRQCLAAQYQEGLQGPNAPKADETVGRRSVRPLSIIMVEHGFLTETQLSQIIDRDAPKNPSTAATIVTAPSRRGPSPVAKSRSLPSGLESQAPSLQPTLPLASPESMDIAVDIPEEVRAAGRNQKNLFGKFILVNQVGSGGFGAVYRAWQRDLKRWVAIKFLHSEDSGDIQRFVREAQTAAGLTHPGIIATYEVSVIDKRTYISMEYIDGKPLSRVRMTPKQALQATRDAARAVAYAHEKDVIHRDLKPGNLMYEASGRVCVMDFGLARNVKGGSTLTISGTVVGTPAFMSPEQAQGDLKSVSTLSDVYSLGATLYDLMTGQPPFEGASPYEVVRKVIDLEPVPPRRIAPRIHPEVETIILKALDKDPAKRYASAADFADDIDRHLKGEPIDAKPVGWVMRGWKKIRRNPVVSVALILGVLGIVVGSTFGFVSLIREKNSLETAKREAENAADAAKRETKAVKDASKAIESALEAERRRVESETKRAGSEKAAANIARLVTAVERLKIMYYRPSFNAGDFHRELKRLEASVLQMTAEMPDRPEPHYLLGRVYLEAEEIESAEKCFRQALAIKPDFSQAHASLARVTFEWVIEMIYFSLAEDEANDHIVKYQVQFESEYKLAMEGTWAEMPGVESDKLLLDVLRAVVARNQDVILKVCQDAWERTHDEEFLRCQAFPYLLMNKPDEGIKQQTAALEIRPGWPRLYLERAVLYALKAFSHGDLRAAVLAEKDLNKAIELNPRMPMAHRGIGFKCSALNQYPKAIEAYETAIKLKPLPLFYSELVNVYKKAKQPAKALEAAEEMVKRWPEYAKSWILRSEMRMDSGDSDGAEKDLRKAAEIRPKDLDVRIGLVNLVAKRGNIDEAIKAATRTISENPGFNRCVGLRGLLLVKKADALRKAGTPGWRSALIDAQDDFKTYFGSKPSPNESIFDQAKVAAMDAKKWLEEE